MPAPFVFLCAWATFAVAYPASAQVLQGEVVGSDGVVVSNALVHLVDEGGQVMATHLTADDGIYRLEVPEPGSYRLEAEALGWAPYQSGVFEMTGLAGVFRVDLIMEPEPFQMEGLEITVERMERVRAQLQQIVGRSVNALRNEPIDIAQFQHAWELGWNLADVVRRGEVGGVFVMETPEAVCFEFRKGCLPVFLNGMRVPDALVRDLPLEMLEVGVVLAPAESIQYEDGGILLYTIHWMQAAR